MRIRFVVLVCFILGTSVTCKPDKKNHKSKKEVTEKDFEVFTTGISEFSGLCQGKTADTFLAISDKRGIFEINKEGNILRKLPLSENIDFEAITINPVNNDIYLADEGNMRIFKLSEDERSLLPVTEIHIIGGVVNKGLEGVAYGNGVLYIVNQESPSILIKYEINSGKETDRIAINYVQQLSDIFYDNNDNSLWICDSKLKKVFHTDLNGIVIDYQSIDYVKKAEAILVDRQAGIIWIGCDQTGFLYKINLKI